MKYNCLKKIVTLVIIVVSFSASGQNPTDLWTSIDDIKAKQTEQVFRKAFPIKETFFQLNVQSLKDRLRNIGNRENPSNTIILFPNSDGELNRFKIFEASIMAPELQVQFPNMRSYAGQGIDNPSEFIRFSITPSGLHAMTLGTVDGTQFIDPFSIEGHIYAVYSKKNLEARNFEFECNVIEETNPIDRSFEANLMARNADDGILRDYRLAVACTGEYATFHGGTVAGAMSAIMTTMTRVNGIYERDLSVTMTLIGNNASIVFTDADSDPFDNDNPIVLLAQSQIVIDGTIGPGNYDIGHTFSTGGGGIAVLGSSCVNGNKARGITGSPQPIGDAYDVDFVAHELGHQYGAPHTFNGNAFETTCATQRSASNAYEPGSGSTIMAYAGICPPQNVQINSDAYFHQNSLQRIWNHITSSGACPTNVTPTGNVEPTANAGDNYTIPGLTPYKLSGSSTDPDGTASHTFTWEQYDLGPAGLPLETITQGPLVRSFEGTTDSDRYVPRFEDVLASSGVSTTWEKLSSVNRNINYRLTVRDNDVAGGQTSFDEMTITNIAGAGPFVVTSQTATEIVWTPGDTETVTWNIAGTTGNGVNTSNVNILLSTDQGATFDTVLASNVPNDGSHPVIVPNISAPRCRIMVEGAGNIFYNINDSFFAIGNYVYELTDVCQDYLFNAGITIPENAGSYTGYNLGIPDNVTISDVNINVNITGANNGDIFHALRGPFQPVGFQQLASGICMGTANQNITFDDEGSAVNCASINNGENVIPQVALSFADGQSSIGNWVFFITDVVVDGVESTLNAVTITICRQEIGAVLSVEQNQLEDLSLYPNPNNGEFNIRFNPKSGEEIIVAVYDIRGRVIFKNSYASVSRFEEAIKLNKAQSGVYLLRISDGSQKVTKKIIVD